VLSLDIVGWMSVCNFACILCSREKLESAGFSLHYVAIREAYPLLYVFSPTATIVFGAAGISATLDAELLSCRNETEWSSARFHRGK
jgi:hypothetical protein